VEIEPIEEAQQPIRPGVQEFAANFGAIASIEDAKSNHEPAADALDFAAYSEMIRTLSFERDPVDVARPPVGPKSLAMPIPHLQWVVDRSRFLEEAG